MVCDCCIGEESLRFPACMQLKFLSWRCFCHLLHSNQHSHLISNFSTLCCWGPACMGGTRAAASRRGLGVTNCPWHQLICTVCSLCQLLGSSSFNPQVSPCAAMSNWNCMPSKAWSFEGHHICSLPEGAWSAERVLGSRLKSRQQAICI